MARALSLLLGTRVRAVVSRCGFATQGVAGPGSPGREPDPDSDWEPEERELQEVESALKRQKKAIQFQKIRRQMEPRGAPPRTLTREAMKQIRYLHEEFPESWSVPRLAEGFDVSPDVIRRVLRSKFVPTLERKLKQDQKVLQKAGLAHSPRQLPGPGGARELLSAGCPVSGGAASSQGQGHSTALRVVEPNAPSTNTPRRQKGGNKGVQSLEKESFVPVAAAQGQQRERQNYSTSDYEGTRGPDRDALPRAKELEALKARELDGQNFSSKVVQRGREFFDDNGNFLYRI
ncbi:neugrin [Pipistrellus kuhlii]|uniref:Neugrin n=2 Tax=Pipistrellus kuhlii TaxID=59472 RepID=A0A7J7S5D5_PIPKU|nr:neugrin [Pipistrellus kuhlii]KAF6283524.1 neugrin, neurite outgrowth associated [Pipistrellus kuhlii]